MSSELLHPQADPLGGGAPFAVGWREGPSPSEAGSTSPRPASAMYPTVGAADLGTGVEMPAAARTTELTFGVARALGTVVVTAQGVLDEVGACALVHVLGDLIENQGNMAVVVDLHDVTDVDPQCLDIFVTAHHWAIVRGGQLSLTGARLRVARALEETGVNRLVKVTSDRILAFPAGFSD